MHDSMNKAIFLDRDGVVCKAVIREGKPFPPASASEMEVLPGVKSAITVFKRLGFKVFIVTNQPDVARGTIKKESVEEINNRLAELLTIDDWLVCYHDDVDRCLCRKPLPGMICQLADKYSLDLSNCIMVGDRWKDIEAGKAAGCITFFVDNNYNEKRPADFNFSVNSLEQVADILRKGTSDYETD